SDETPNGQQKGHLLALSKPVGCRNSIFAAKPPVVRRRMASPREGDGSRRKTELVVRSLPLPLAVRAGGVQEPTARGPGDLQRDRVSALHRSRKERARFRAA